MQTQYVDTWEFLVGSSQGSDEDKAGVLPIFDEGVLDFFDSVSRRIFADSNNKKYPDILTFGFWCRKESLKREKAEYIDDHIHLGRGMVFHIAPSNIPVLFAYSLVTGLLAGNSNVVRVPSKDFWQTTYLCNLLKEQLDEDRFAYLRPYITCVRYVHDHTSATQYYSERCDARVLWGGDKSVAAIRESTRLKPRSVEITFPDRYSIAVIDSDAWLSCSDKDRVIKGFYNDTYLTDQNSCASPYFILWIGQKVQDARDDFWKALYERVRNQYELKGIQSVHKLEYVYRMVDRFPKVKHCSENNFVVRIWTDTIQKGMVEFRPGGGFFVESSAENLDALEPLLESRCQTLSYFGVDPQQIEQMIYRLAPKGIDRVVPIGNTLNFSLVWDGIDMIKALSRTIIIDKL